MRIYLAGPMRGIPEFNFPAFADATAKLRALGYEVFSPAEKDTDDGFESGGLKGDDYELKMADFDLAKALAMDLEYICRHAEAVVLLPGWEMSEGTKAEVATAHALGKPVWLLGNVLKGEVGAVNSINAMRSAMGFPAFDAYHGTKGRTFDSGAYRDAETGKLDYEGFLSPAVLGEFAFYMHKHRRQSNGELRDSDNWQKGIPLDVYMKSMFRHFMDVWFAHRGLPTDADDQLDALMALLFNVQGYAHELLNGRDL